MKILSIGCWIMLTVTGWSAGEAASSGRALYRVKLSPQAHPQQVAKVELAYSKVQDRSTDYLFHLIGHKLNGQTYTFWFKVNGNPFTARSGKALHFERYFLQECRQPPVEYIEERTGNALLPIFHFVEELLPRANKGEKQILFEKGSYLGLPLERTALLPSQPVTCPAEPIRLVLNPDLLIGTSRNFRDDGKGRKSERDDYHYIPLSETDYEELIAAGFNYFVTRPEQAAWLCRKPVFYEGHTPGPEFPEELYRSNFYGWRMFIDEPACRLAGKYPRDATPRQAVRMLHEHIREKINNTFYRDYLKKAGIDTGHLKLSEPAVPIWETYVGTCYYQLEANQYGFIQECRWQLRPGNNDRGRILQRLNQRFGVNIPVTPENLFLWYYAQIIGPARAFSAHWGMSFYGHAESELRLPSMKLAYDLGATYIWFWTSDHNHHVPYRDQLALARAITDHTRNHPRPTPDQLIQKAKTAIVLPYGYTLPSCWELDMFGSYVFSLNRKNERGISYEQMLAPAIREIERCLVNGIAYDVLPDGEKFNPDLYDHVVRLNPDGTIRRTK